MAGEHRDDLVMQSLLLDEIGQSVIGMDGDWRITYWNRASERLYGLGPDKVLGLKITDLGIIGGAEVRGAGATDREIANRVARGGDWAGELWARHSTEIGRAHV